MDEIVLLSSLAMFLLLAAACSIVFNKIKLPPLIGYLISGIIVANFFQVTETGEDVVEILSNMGLIMLMFCIGLEINLKKLRKQGVFAMRVALVEIPFMVLGGTVIGLLIGLDSIQSIALGSVMAGSSTAVVLGVLAMQNRLEKDRIDTLILVIIMEDIAQVIILTMITPLMAGNTLDPGAVAAMVVSILAFMIVSIFAGLKLMPRIINWVSDNVSPEVLVIFAVGLAFGMALVANYIGLSVAIGAFLMGMMIASSRKSKEILHSIEPMKNIFMAMFFISVGMEIELGTLIDNIALTLGIMMIFITLKVIAVFSGYWLANDTARDSFRTAVSFLAMGEFAFIIAKQAFDYDVFSDALYTSIVGAALLSMIALPLISGNSVKLWDITAEKMPLRMKTFLWRIEATKSAIYGNMSSTSKRTRKEISSSLTRSNICILLVVMIEIIFILITPPLSRWIVTYFGIPAILSNGILLLLNLFALMYPLYKLVSDLKSIYSMSRSNSPDGRRSLLESIYKTDSLLLSVMIGITILIIIPNELGLGEHFIVLLVALIILLIYNKRALEKKREEEMAAIAEDENFFVTMDTETFIDMMAQKAGASEKAEEEQPQPRNGLMEIEPRGQN